MLWMVTYSESPFLDSSFLRWSVTTLSLMTARLRLLFLFMLLRLSELRTLLTLRALCLLITSSNESSLSMEGMLDRFPLMPSSILIRSLSKVPMFSITSSTALGIRFRTGLNKSWLICTSMSLLASLSFGRFELSVLRLSWNRLPNWQKRKMRRQKCFRNIQRLTFCQRWCSCCLKAISRSFLVMMQVVTTSYDNLWLSVWALLQDEVVSAKAIAFTVEFAKLWKLGALRMALRLWLCCERTGR